MRGMVATQDKRGSRTSDTAHVLHANLPDQRLPKIRSRF